MRELVLAERTGWTLDYIDSLDSAQFGRILAVYDAIDKAKAYSQRGAD